MPVEKETDASWTRKHDKPGTALTAPSIVYPTSLEDLIEVCSHQPPRLRLHAAGSHWGLSTAAISDHTFIETHDPCNRHRAMARTLFEVIPNCMTQEYLDLMGRRRPPSFERNLDDETPYFVHIETGKRVYELYAELDQDAAADPRSLAHVLAVTHSNPHYSGPWAFRTLGSAGGQTVFGALTTGTHGGDYARPPIADDVVALHLVATGGRHYWIEPATPPGGEPQLTDDDALRSVYGTQRYGGQQNFEIVRDDDVFFAVLVGAHRFGVVYSIVLRAVRQYMMRETRLLGTWQNVRTAIRDGNPWLYRVPPDNKFLQIVVCLTPHNGFTRNLVGISKRSDASWNPASGPPLGRVARVGDLKPDPDPLTGGPVFTAAGNSFPLPPDQTDPAKAADGSFLERACANGDFLEGVIESAIDDIQKLIDRPNDPVPAAIAAVAVVGGGSGLLALLAPLAIVVGVLAALLAELRGSGDKRFGQVLDRVRDTLLDFPDPIVRQAGLFAWQLIAFKAFTAQQGPIDYTAISYAIMDTHDYHDQSCNVNVDSIEVFFEAQDPMLLAFVDALIAFEIRQEFEGRAFLGYASLRFTGKTRALLGPERWRRTCVVEVAGLKDVKGTSNLIDYAIALSRNPNFGGVLHWGQRNESDREDIERRFGDPNDPRNGDLGRWREAVERINSDSDAFSSEFTRRTGLEVS